VALFVIFVLTNNGITISPLMVCRSRESDSEISWFRVKHEMKSDTNASCSRFRYQKGDGIWRDQ
jgi:hypothetical protein